MRLRNRTLLDVLVGAGLYLLDPVRDRLADRIGDLSDRARDTYDEASGRVSRASRAIRGDDSHVVGSVGALLLGIGVGVGVGLLLAPASGEETRSKVAEKVQDFGDKVWRRAGRQPEGSTGTYGA
jgi:hypothetical protein